MFKVTYSDGDKLPFRFFNHAYMALKRDLPGHVWKDEKYIERAGDALLWSMESLPKIVWEKLKDPRIVTITLTKFALLLNSYLFYPSLTRKYAVKVMNALLVEAWKVKFAAYVWTCSLIIGAGARALGRLTNKDLMHKFYSNKIRVQEAPQNNREKE